MCASLMRMSREFSRPSASGAAELIVPERTTVQEGDFCRIDFLGFIDGKPFSGGAAEDYMIRVGAGQFIPGFEEQMIGMEVGQTSEIKVTFPEDYHAEHLAEQEAVFKVTIKELKEKVLPELDDEFAKDISDFDTLEELRGYIRKTSRTKPPAEPTKRWRINY